MEPCTRPAPTGGHLASSGAIAYWRQQLCHVRPVIGTTSALPAALLFCAGRSVYNKDCLADSDHLLPALQVGRVAAIVAGPAAAPRPRCGIAPDYQHVAKVSHNRLKDTLHFKAAL